MHLNCENSRKNDKFTGEMHWQMNSSVSTLRTVTGYFCVVCAAARAVSVVQWLLQSPPIFFLFETSLMFYRNRIFVSITAHRVFSHRDERRASKDCGSTCIYTHAVKYKSQSKSAQMTLREAGTKDDPHPSVSLLRRAFNMRNLAK